MYIHTYIHIYACEKKHFPKLRHIDARRAPLLDRLAPELVEAWANSPPPNLTSIRVSQSFAWLNTPKLFAKLARRMIRTKLDQVNLQLIKMNDDDDMGTGSSSSVEQTGLVDLRARQQLNLMLPLDLSCCGLSKESFKCLPSLLKLLKKLAGVMI
jgi:hypothetical protein